MTGERFIGLHGVEDPCTATFPFTTVNGALDAGLKTAIILVGDAVGLMNSTAADNIHGVGLLPLKHVMSTVVAEKVPIYV